MKSEVTKWKISKISELSKKGFFKVNQDYQRGPVWTARQRKMLIDSLLRGYTIPIIYLHKIVEQLDGINEKAIRYEIVDGQQRILALEQFMQDNWPLLDPDADPDFPKFHKGNKSDWAGKRFSDIMQPFKDAFLNAERSVCLIETDRENEIRDLFVRLQAGVPLNPQEKRDAWPGKMNEFILKLGGKEDQYEQHEFFKKTRISFKRGKSRTVCAQMTTLLLKYMRDHIIADTESESLDNLYLNEVDFDHNCEDAVRVIAILDKLSSALWDLGFSLKTHEAIHLSVLTQFLMEEYTDGWDLFLKDILIDFRAKVAKANYDKQGEVWDNYAQWTRTDANKKDSIEKRHRFFVNFFIPRLIEKGLKQKDPKRNFSPLEKEVVYFTAKGICAECKLFVPWIDAQAQIDHTDCHASGGSSDLNNARLLCRSCHYKKH